MKKNELESHIKAGLSGSKDTSLPKSVSNRNTGGSRDRLLPDSYVVNYVSDRATNVFLKEEIPKRDPDLKDRSGRLYWLNDWLKEKIRNNWKIIYQEVINQLCESMTTNGRLPRIPSTRFNHFITDFLADPENKGMARQGAFDEWERLIIHCVTAVWQKLSSQRSALPLQSIADPFADWNKEHPFARTSLHIDVSADAALTDEFQPGQALQKVCRHFGPIAERGQNFRISQSLRKRLRFLNVIISDRYLMPFQFC